MKYMWGFFLASALLAMTVGCGKSPPLIDLKEHEVIGVIEFKAGGDEELAKYITRRFIDAVRKDQGTVSIIELGPEQSALQAVGRHRLDADAFKALGDKHKIRTIFFGEIEVANIMPDVSITPGLDFIKVQADVEAVVQAQMIETATGASLWSGTGRAVEKIGKIDFSGGGIVGFDAENPNRTYKKLFDKAIKEVTKEFRMGWGL
jgi:hypothetical protein